MKKNVIKKIASTVLAAVMVTSIGFASFAATDDDEVFPNPNTDQNQEGWIITTEEAEGLGAVTYKVYFDRPDATVTPQNSNRLATQFTYTIAPGTAIAPTATTWEIKAGPAGGALFDTGDNATDAFVINAGDDADPDLIKVTFETSEFTGGAGIYRYVITQAAMTDEQAALKIEAEGAVDTWVTGAVTRYLDLFVTDDNIIESAVLSRAAEAPAIQEAQGAQEGEEEAVYAQKTDGFHNRETLYPFDIVKTVTGSMANSTKKFPFSVQLIYTEPTTGNDANTTATGLIAYYTIEDADGDEGELQQITVGAAATTIEIAANEKIHFYNVPATVKVDVTETIAAGEGYTIKATVAGNTLTEVANSNNTSDDSNPCHANGAVSAVVTASDATTGTITYNNIRNAISPTGVILRYAPYIIMIAAAAVLVVMVVKSKKKNEEEA